MKIAFVTPEFITEEKTFDGGLANYLQRIGLALIKLGHEPHVFVSSDVDEIIDLKGITVHRVRIDYVDKGFRFRRFMSRGKSDLSLTWLHIGNTLNKRLREVNKTEKFDIAQYASYGGMAFHRVKNIPAVVRLSSYEPLFRDARGIIPNYDDLQVERIEKDAMRRADAVFGPSKLSADAVRNDLGIDVRLIETPFILDTSKLDTSVYDSLLKGKKYLLYWGTVSRLKGARNIIEILPELLTKHADLNFVFVGKAEPGIITELEQRTEDVRDRVIHVERLQHEQLYPIIQNSFAAILPSLYDNLPNTCIEAMAFGKAVVGTRGASFDQLIDDGVSGFLCEKNNSQDLLRVIEKVLASSTEELSKIGEKAVARIEMLKPEKVVVELVNFYSEVINS